MMYFLSVYMNISYPMCLFLLSPCKLQHVILWKEAVLFSSENDSGYTLCTIFLCDLSFFFFFFFFLLCWSRSGSQQCKPLLLQYYQVWGTLKNPNKSLSDKGTDKFDKSVNAYFNVHNFFSLNFTNHLLRCHKAISHSI